MLAKAWLENLISSTSMTDPNKIKLASSVLKLVNPDSTLSEHQQKEVESGINKLANSEPVTNKGTIMGVGAFAIAAYINTCK